MMYQAVLEAVIAVEKEMKPGVSWPAMHRLASRVLLQHLVKVYMRWAHIIFIRPNWLTGKKGAEGVTLREVNHLRTWRVLPLSAAF